MSKPVVVNLPRMLRVCVIAVILVSACTRWHPLPGASLAESGSERLGHLRLVLRDGTELELRDATLGRDSIVGFGGETHARLAVARAEVTDVDSRQPDDVGTFLVGALTPVLLSSLLLLAVVIALSHEGT
jgi:hypothetical protein